jgi:hypothetical protein
MLKFIEDDIIDLAFDYFKANPLARYFIISKYHFYKRFRDCYSLKYQRNDTFIIPFGVFILCVINSQICSNHKLKNKNTKKVKILRYKTQLKQNEKL